MRAVELCSKARLSIRRVWPRSSVSLAFYLFDLYDFVVMHDRRELVLRLVQALGLGWVALALTFYALSAPDAGPWYFADCVAAGAEPDGWLASVDSLVPGPSGFW